MKIWKIAAICAAVFAVYTLPTRAASPVFEPRTPVQDSMGPGEAFADRAESMMEDVLPADPAESGTADATLGDTNGDGIVESEDGTGAAESILESAVGTDMMTETDTAKDTADATDTAQSSSGADEERGMGTLGIFVTIAVIGAGAVLLFALWPKKKA